MAVIDIGPGATNRAITRSATHTTLSVDNPANDTGVLDTFECWANTDIGGLKLGTFYGSGTSWTVRDYETIGDVASGSKQTFTGKNCDVETNDILGFYCTSGTMEHDGSGFGGILSKASTDCFVLGTQTYSTGAGDASSIYATGETAAAGNPYHYYLQQ